MAKSKNKFEQDVEAHDGANTAFPDLIKKFETHEKTLRSDFVALPAEIFNLIIDISKTSSELVRSFNWLNQITGYRKQENGGVVFECENAMIANRMFDFLGFKLQAHFKTDKLATRHDGKAVRFWSVRSEGDDKDRKLSPGTQKLMTDLRNSTYEMPF